MIAIEEAGTMTDAEAEKREAERREREAARHAEIEAISIAREAGRFELVLSACRYGFELRQPDARDRVEALFKYYGGMVGLTASKAWRTEYRRRSQVLAAMLAEFENRNLNRKMYKTPGPTPHARAHENEGRAVLRLYEAGHLSESQLQAARRIAKVYESVSAAVMCSGRDLSSMVRGSASFTDLRLPEVVAWDHAHLYLPWLGKLRAEGIPLPFVIDVVALDVALDSVRREHGMGFPRAVKVIQQALDLFLDAVNERRG